MDVIMISGSCCIPSMANLDNAARKIIDEAISITGAPVQVSIITASTAYGNAAFRKLIKKEIGISDAPVILIDGEVISYGVPKIDDVKDALIRFSKKNKEN